VGVFGRGLLAGFVRRGRPADFFGRGRPAGFFTGAFGMIRWWEGEGEGLGKKGKF